MSAAGWLRVANGLRLVVSSASTLVAKEGATGAASLTKHGIDLANNAKTVVAAAGVSLPSRVNMPRGPSGFRQSDSSSVAMNSTPPAQEVGNSQHTTNDDVSNIDALENANSQNESGSPEMVTREIGADQSNFFKEPLEKHHTNDIYGTSAQSMQENIQRMNNPTLLQEGQEVPSTRIGRAVGFASLGVGLIAGTMVETASRVVSTVTFSNETNSGSIVTNDANADRIAKTLCRMRGAALKLGQMLSIQDETILPESMSRALEKVRQGADAMPTHQLKTQLEVELGKEWRDKFDSFEDLPFAAASIGQVHRASIEQNGEKKDVVVKVQYPGVANSIESDLRNLTMLVKLSGFAPPGLFIERVIEVGRDELKVECDYIREANNQKRLQELVHGDSDLSRAKFRVPSVYSDHSSKGVLTTEFCPGGTIDKVAFLDQEERNRIGRNIMRLTVKELFTWRFMQTDPNWGNFLYDVGTGTTYLIDFGSTREYSKEFVDGYLRIVWACANVDTKTLMDQSLEMGFLTGEENDIMLEAHKLSGFTLGEPFATDEEYDFKNSGITRRLSEHGSAFLQHRLTPPPEEVYTLHRKLAGAFNLCIKLGAEIRCRDLLEEVVQNHVFEDGKPHPRAF